MLGALFAICFVSLAPIVVRYTTPPVAWQYAQRPAISHGGQRIATKDEGLGGAGSVTDAGGGAASGIG